MFDAKNGGFIARGEINRDVPLENAEAMFQAFLEYECYDSCQKTMEVK